jgi:hypothetical protein
VGLSVAPGGRRRVAQSLCPGTARGELRGPVVAASLLGGALRCGAAARSLAAHPQRPRPSVSGLRPPRRAGRGADSVLVPHQQAHLRFGDGPAAGRAVAAHGARPRRALALPAARDRGGALQRAVRDGDPRPPRARSSQRQPGRRPDRAGGPGTCRAAPPQAAPPEAPSGPDSRGGHGGAGGLAPRGCPRPLSARDAASQSPAAGGDVAPPSRGCDRPRRPWAGRAARPRGPQCRGGARRWCRRRTRRRAR